VARDSEARGGPDQGSNPGWPCSGGRRPPLQSRWRKSTQTPRSWASGARSARPPPTGMRYRVVCGDPPMLLSQLEIDQSRPWLCASFEKVPAFCWLLCRTSNSLRQITKSRSSASSVFQMRHFRLWQLFLEVPYPRPNFTAEAVHCQSRPARRAGLGKALRQNRIG
jgi:hypothetical protein